MSDEGQVAGKLSILVEAAVGRFKQELETKVEKAAAGVAAEVGIDVDEGDVKAQIEEKVKAAARGVAAKVGLDVDEGGFKAKVKATAKSIREKAKIKVEADTDGVVAETVAVAKAAQLAAGRIPLRVRLEIMGDELGKRAGNSSIARGASSLLGGIFGGGGDGPGGSGGSPGGGSPFRLRTLFRGGVIFGLLSLIQPLVGAIGQVVAGLTAMAGAAAPAVGALAAFPITIGAMIQGFMAGKVAMQGVGDAMKLLAEEQSALARGEKLSAAQQEKLNQALSELSPSARKAARSLVGLRDAWVKVRKPVQEALFSKIADQIEPLANDLLPLLQRELTRTSGVLGTNLRAVMVYLQTWQAQKKIGHVMKANSGLFGDFLYMLGRVGDGMLHLMMASRKFSNVVGKNMREAGDWFFTKAFTNRHNGDFRAFLVEATEKASQLWNILKQFGGGMAGIFRAAYPSGERLLTTFEGFLTNWHEWVDSAKGQNYLRDWFDGAEGGFIEFSRMVNDTFKAIAKWANDPKIERMLHMVRTEMGPALSDFFKKLGDDAGEGVLTFLSEFIKLLTHLEPAIETIGELTKVINKLLKALNWLAELSPGTTDAVARILGGLLVLKTIGRLGKFAGALTGIGKAAGKNAGKLSRFTSAMGKLSKMPLLKKAGIVGAVLTAIDIASQLKTAYNAGKNLRKSFNDGFADGPGTKKSKTAVDDMFKEWMPKDAGWAPDFFGADFGKWFDDFHIDVDRLKTDMSKFGTQGTYYKEVLDKLKAANDGAIDGGWGNRTAGNMIPFLNTDVEKAAKLIGSIEKLGGEADRAIAQFSKKRSIQWNIEALIDLGKAKVQDSGVQSAAAQIRQTLMEKLGIKPNADGKGGLFELLIDPLIKPRDKKPKQPFEPTASNPFNSFWGTNPTKGPKGPKAPDTRPIKRSAEEIRRAASRAGAAWGETATRVTRSAKKQAAAVGTVKRSLDGVPKKVKAVGDSWSGAARKAASSTKMTARGAKTLEAASKRAEGAAKRAGAAASKAYNGMEAKARKAANGASKAISNMTNTVRSKVATLGRNVSRGMDGVVRAVRSKVGPSKAAAKQIASGIHGAFKSLPGKMTSVGGQAMDGLANGIRTRGAAAVEAARSIAAQIESASRVQLDTHSPSRVMDKVGVDTMDGLANGIIRQGRRVVAASLNVVRGVKNTVESGLKGIKNIAVDGSLGENLIARLLPGKKKSKGAKRRRAFKEMFSEFLTGSFFQGITKGGVEKVKKSFQAMYAKLDKIIPNTKAGKRRMRQIKREFRDEMRLLVENAKQREAVQKKIAEARAKVEDLKARKERMTESWKSAADETGSISNIAAANGGFISPQRLINQLKRKVQKAYEFKRLMADLRTKGLGEEAYQQLMDLGFDEGLPIARQLAKGDSAALQEITRLQTELDSIAEAGAKESSKHFFDAGIDAGEAFVKKLQGDLQKLEDVAKTMGKAFMSELEAIFGLNLGVKNGDNLNANTAGADGDGGDGGMHRWVPKSEKNRACKKCGKARNTSKHSNRTDSGGAPVGGGAGTSAGGPVSGRTAVMAGLAASGASARTEAASGDSYVVNETYQFTISGVPDQATAAAVINEAQFQIKKHKAGGAKRGRRKR